MNHVDKRYIARWYYSYSIETISKQDLCKETIGSLQLKLHEYKMMLTSADTQLQQLRRVVRKEEGKNCYGTLMKIFNCLTFYAFSSIRNTKKSITNLQKTKKTLKRNIIIIEDAFRKYSQARSSDL